MRQKNNFDLVILGSGSTAFAAAISAAARGKTVLMTEERAIGGTCLHRGCIPSKNLIEAAGICHLTRCQRYPGLLLEPAEVDFSKLIAQKNEVVSSLERKKYLGVSDENERIEIRRGQAQFVDGSSISVDGQVFQGDHILIATGSRPYIPPIAGLDEVDFLTSDLLTDGEEQALKELPEELVILGGGYIALELGQMFARLGSNVHLLERSASLLPRYEPEIGAALASIFREEGLNVRTSISVERVEEIGGRIRCHTSSGAVEGTHLLIAAGRRPNVGRIGLSEAGIETSAEGFIPVDQYLQTAIPHIWAAGDVIQAPMATPVGGHDGTLVANNAFFGERRRADHTNIPRAIFTDPQVAAVGLTDSEAMASDLSCECRVVAMEHIPRAAAVRDNRGLIKTVVERESRRIVGVSILAPHASELIHTAALAIKAKLTVDDLIDQIFVYPTFSEALKIGALAFKTDVTKLSCCAEGA